MNLTYDKILFLYLESMAGTISPEDSEMVYRELDKNDEFKAIWLEMEGISDPDRLKNFIADIDTEQELSSLKRRIPPPLILIKKHRFRQFRKIAAVICVFLGLSALGYMSFKNRGTTNKTNIVKNIEKKVASFQLVLSNGKTVVFTSADSTKTLLVNGSATTIALSRRNMQYNSQDTGINILRIPEGQTYNLSLSDGTVVMLNSGSTIKFPFRFTGTQRNVYLEGEAFFKVSKDAKHPFIVHTPLTQIKVLGTQFDVNTYQTGSVKTSLIEGKVETHSLDGKSMTLSPGFQADYGTLEGFSKNKFDKSDVLSWMNGVYYFHDKPVNDLIGLIYRCYGVKVNIDNPKLKNIAMTGVMEKDNLLGFLTDLQTTAGIKFYYKSDILNLQ